MGTVVEVGEGGRSALVQWDGGTRGRYRCGEDNKFDLRLFDAAPAGEAPVGEAPAGEAAMALLNSIVIYTSRQAGAL